MRTAATSLLGRRCTHSFRCRASCWNGSPRNPRLPRWGLSHWPVRILAPDFGLTQDYIRKHLGIRFAVDNHRSVEELGLVYRPFEETRTDHYLAWRGQRETGR